MYTRVLVIWVSAYMGSNWGKIHKIPQTFQDHICGPQIFQQKMVSICFPYIQNKLFTGNIHKYSPYSLRQWLMEQKFSSWHQINVREGRVGSLYTLINNTSPENPQKTTYVNIWQSIKTNLYLFLPLCNHGDFRFSKTLNWNMIYTNAGLNLRDDLRRVWCYCKQPMTGEAEKTQDKSLSEWPVSWSRFQPSWMQSRTNHKTATINANWVQ